MLLAKVSEGIQNGGKYPFVGEGGENILNETSFFEIVLIETI